MSAQDPQEHLLHKQDTISRQLATTSRTLFANS